MKHTLFRQKLSALACPDAVKQRAIALSESLDDAERQKVFDELADLSAKYVAAAAKEEELIAQLETFTRTSEKAFATAERQENEKLDRAQDDTYADYLLDA
jgi:hypothetical protein